MGQACLTTRSVMEKQNGLTRAPMMGLQTKPLPRFLDAEDRVPWSYSANGGIFYQECMDECRN